MRSLAFHTFPSVFRRDWNLEFYLCVCVYFHALDKAWYLTIINKQVRLFNSFCSGNYLCRRCFVYEGIFTLYSISDLDNQYRNNVHHRCKIMHSLQCCSREDIRYTKDYNSKTKFWRRYNLIVRQRGGPFENSVFYQCSFIDEKSLQIYIALKFGHI